MKKLMAVALLAIAAAGFAADGRFLVKNIRFFTRFTLVPRYENDSSTSKTAQNTRWLCMETTFVPEVLPGKTEQWYDDVTMEGTLVISRADEKNMSYIVLTGKTRFFTVPADGKSHVGMFYVPPKILARYLGSKNGEPMVQMAKVAFYMPGRVLLGEGYWAAQGVGKKGKFVHDKNGSREYRAVVERMKEYEKNYSNVIMLRGGLYSKEKTPWAYYSYDLYDLIYDNVLQQESDIKR